MNSHISFQKKTLGILVFLALYGCAPGIFARDYFNPALLEKNNAATGDIDLSSFEEGMQKPGKYRVDIMLNGQYFDSQDIAFSAKESSDNLYPCLSLAQLKQMGVSIEQFPDLKETEGCANFEIIPQATATYQLANQQLQLNIPQAALSVNPHGYVSPELWDQGMLAFLLNYSVSGDETQNKSGGSSNSKYANLRPGINIGPWRIRNYITWSRDSEGNNSADNVYTYAQRDITALKGRLLLGDSSSSSDIFDSVPFRGAQLASDEDMMPDSMRGYAPVVRGIARSNAQVIIRQNSYVIYQSYVPAGAFEIKDLYATGGSGDLNVTIKEQDGSMQNFVVPYASLPLLQREGNSKYSVTGGNYRSYNSNVEKTPFVQSTLIYGLPYGITAYGGVQFSDHYTSAALGVGRNLGAIGAFSADIIAAHSDPKDSAKVSGRSFRVRYSKDFVETGTNFAIAGYRYSTKGFYGLQEIMESYGSENALTDRRRNRAELTLTQSLGGNLGSLTGSAVQEQYWTNNMTMRSYSLSYNNSFRNIGYSISYSSNKNTTSYDHDTDENNDQRIMINLSIPFSSFLPNTWVNYNLNSSEQGGTSQTLGMSGTALEGENLSWNVQQSKDRTGHSGGANVDYRGVMAETSAGYNYSPTSSQVNYQISGGIVAHSGGITLSQPLGETLALVEAKDAKGTGVFNQIGTKVDGSGYAVISNLTPYHKNIVTLDTSTFNDDVEIETNGATVIPTKGAIVKANFVSHSGFKALITLKTATGSVPFGALVSLTGSKESRGFITGDAGQVYVTGMDQKEGVLMAHWGNDNAHTCTAHYVLPGKPTAGGIYTLSTNCES
ncbi:TPA: fimbrial biogenesis outer membrane usher protein [Citrobacter farmeri]|uniref:fimbria/pilus outer membrane usher protein n=1 Tax=Citrobacter farmeri TaxID=67824 RepID=UPI0038904F7A|nr:fimbrial biogenesis outer membrane usher protein [Citrobacter farmeri]